MRGVAAGGGDALTDCTGTKNLCSPLGAVNRSAALAPHKAQCCSAWVSAGGEAGTGAPDCSPV